LSNSEKFILDATAGHRRMWENKHHPNTLYIDQRPEVNRDEVRDFRDLPYSDESFNLIVFDPPHDIRVKPSDVNSRFIQDFWYLTPESWQSDVKRGLAECWRCLKPMGVLIFKWNTMCKKESSVIPLFPAKPLFYQITKGNITAKKSESKTLWFCFMKILQEKNKSV
jgi:hypothetical protein